MNNKRFKRKLKKIRQQCEQYKQEKELVDSYAEYWPERKKRKISNIMLVALVISITIYTIAAFWLQFKTGVEVSPTLTTVFFSFWIGEVFSLAGIRITKVLKGDQNNHHMHNDDMHDPEE